MAQRITNHPRRAQRRKDADERQKFRNSYSDEQQLQVLDRRLGTGVGAAKERARLTARISAETERLRAEERRAAKPQKIKKVRGPREIA